jgi:hypothetical protein
MSLTAIETHDQKPASITTAPPSIAAIPISTPIYNIARQNHESGGALIAGKRFPTTSLRRARIQR